MAPDEDPLTTETQTMETLRWVLTRITAAVAVVVGLALLLLLLALPAVYVANAAVSTVENDLLDIPPLPADDIEPLAETSRVFDADGDELAELHGPIRRTLADLDEIPEITRQAVLATEDADFFTHPGVDHESVIRAAIRNLREGRAAEGASTITQQYVRQALLDPEQTIERKLQEVVWAVELEQHVSKDEILERYLNTVYLGNGVYGFATAADHYFSKSVEDLDAAESALLAGIIRAPELNDPVSEPERAQARRDIVLRQMAATGFITEAAAEEARSRDIELEVREEEAREEFWIDWVKRIVYDPRVDLQPELQEAIGETPEERIQAVFEGGLRIHTSLDPRMQSIAEEIVSEHLPDPIHDPMGALITLDPSDGSVRAMALGPKDFGPCPEDEEPCEVTNVNPAVPGIGGSGRQAGSAFKPLVSATALDRGIGTDREYDTASGEEIEDCGPEDDPYAPHNYDREDHGEMEMDEAMRRSVNVYFAKLARDAGVLSTVQTAQALGIVNSPNLDEGHFGPRSCSIGLGTVNVFPLEMTVAYAAFNNEGARCDPHVITEITDRGGEVLYSHEADCEQVLDPSDARSLTSLLGEPVGDGGTAGVVGAQVPGAVGKTGTTDSHVDAWFVGSAGGLTTSAWIGYEDPRAMTSVEIGGRFHAQVTGGSLPAPLWASYKQDIAALGD